jgi:hypothetical protein
MYTLATALAVFSSWAMFRAKSSGFLWWWITYSILAILLAYTHYYGLFTIAAQGAFLLGFVLSQVNWNWYDLIRRSDFWHTLLAMVLVTLCWLPWLPTFLQQRGQVQADYWTKPVTLSDVGRLCYTMFVKPEHALAPPSPSARLWAIDLCVLGLWALRRKAMAAEWYVICAATLPLAFSILVSAYDTKVFGFRFFLPAHVFLLIGINALIWRIPFTPERIALSLVLVAFLFWLCVDFLVAMDLTHRPGARAAAQYISEHSKSGEPVIVCRSYFYLPMLYYARDPRNLYLLVDEKPIMHYEGAAALSAQDSITIEQLKDGIVTNTIWVVEARGEYWGELTVTLPSSWIVVNRSEFNDMSGVGTLVVLEYHHHPRIDAVP